MIGELLLGGYSDRDIVRVDPRSAELLDRCARRKRSEQQRRGASRPKLGENPSCHAAIMSLATRLARGQEADERCC